MKVEEMQKFNIGDYPTPLQKMEKLSKKHHASLYIKRDDIMGPALSGNKTRKLEYIMKDAVDKGYNAILTTGGPGTSHARTTISAACQFGMKPILVRNKPMPESLSGNLAIDAMMGCDIVNVVGNLQDGIQKTIEKYESEGYKVYNLPAKSSTEIGAAGYIMCIKEIMDQCEQMDIHPEYLVCGTASLGTYAGLLCGAEYFKAPFKVIGIPATKYSETDKENYVGFINELAEFYQMHFTMTKYYLNILGGSEEHPYYTNDVTKMDLDVFDTMMELAREEGIILDPEYTGRAFRGFLDLVDTGKIKGDCIFIHTGGGQSTWTLEQTEAVQEVLKKNCSITQI